MLDLDPVRAAFPGLAADPEERGPPLPRFAHLDNAGGTLMPTPVIERIAAALRRGSIARGSPHPRSRAIDDDLRAGHEAVAELLGADADEVILGPSTTHNLDRIAQALAAGWRPGDRVIVSALDHEANLGPWRRLARLGLEVVTWPLRRETASLEVDDLRPLLTDRTRLVAFTHCANVVGAIVDVAAITRVIHDAGALACVDGVAEAPHRRVDVRALEVDLYAISLYKIYGPQVGALFGRAELLRGGGPIHPFVAADEVPYRYEVGGPLHALCAGLPGILEHFDALDTDHFGSRGDAAVADPGRIHRLLAEHEAALTGRLLGALRSSPRARILGPTGAGIDERVALIAFTIDGEDPRAIVRALAEVGVNARSGHFYAPEALRALGVDGRGVVRLSLAHYNSDEEIERAIAGLAPLLG
ncbi:MAG: cysteine desulfurase-like protein [Nannocystaceae bacterium]